VFTEKTAQGRMFKLTNRHSTRTPAVNCSLKVFYPDGVN